MEPERSITKARLRGGRLVVVGAGGGTTLINRSRLLGASQATAGLRGRKRRFGVGIGVDVGVDDEGDVTVDGVVDAVVDIGVGVYVGVSV